MTDEPKLLSLFDYETAAVERLPQMVYDYYRGGAGDEITVRENRAAYERLRVHYHVLRDVSERNIAVNVLGHDVALPILVAPTAFQRMAHPDGELATARAAGAAGTIMMLSTLSNTPIEDVVAAATGPVWFQLYVYRDRDATAALVARAVAAGCSAIVLTVDAPILGTRERDVRNGFHLPEGLAVSNLLAAGHGDIGVAAGSALQQYVHDLFEPALTLDVLEWLCGLTDLPVLVKGVCRPDDAVAALDRGAAGVIVSNHGGRQLDTAPATIDVLPGVVDAVAGRAPVIVDGGVRRGIDVLKALARGATAVAVGRPILWGLTVDGQAGVQRVLDLLRIELHMAMALSGTTSVDAVSRDLLGPDEGR